MSATRAYKAPAGISQIDVGGQTYTVKDGEIQFPVDHSDVLIRGHGFLPVEVEEEPKQAVASIDDLHKVDTE